VRFTLYANVDPDDDETMQAVHSDEVVSAEPFSLPGDYLATSFEIELSGRHTIKRFVMASSIDQLTRS
jgi:hypothetical protein